MVPEHKLNNALAALNAILAVVRAMAYERRPHDEIASALDAAEYLPRILAEVENRTESFRETLVDLTKLNASFTFALEQFDGASLGRW